MEQIFAELNGAELLELAQLMSFNPLVESRPLGLFSGLEDCDKAKWLELNRDQLSDELLRLGSWSFGATKPYSQIVADLSAKVGVKFNISDPTDAIERALILKLWDDTVSNLTPQQVKELKKSAEDLAAKYGKSIGAEITGFAALGAAQLSGFGVYLLGSTILGALNGALGLGLSFGAFTGLSSLISTVIGPVGWATLGVFAVVKLGAPSYKKVLPAVIFIAARRSLIYERNSLLEARSRPLGQGPILLPASWDLSESQIKPKVPVVISDAEVSSEPLTEFEADVKVSTNKAKTVNEKKPKLGEAKTKIPSKMDRIVFDLAPENRLLVQITAESVDRHFLDLSDEEQNDIRSMAKERKDIEMLLSEHDRSSMKHVEVGDGMLSKSERKGGAKPNARRRLRNKMKATFPNLDFSDQALDRLGGYENSSLDTAFASEFRFLNEGVIDDKHHVPNTDPAMFQRDCGRSGKVYYRRAHNAWSVAIELIGDKSSQEHDMNQLRN